MHFGHRWIFYIGAGTGYCYQQDHHAYPSEANYDSFKHGAKYLYGSNEKRSYEKIAIAVISGCKFVTYLVIFVDRSHYDQSIDYLILSYNPNHITQ